jgi:hypothetical protein
LASGSRVRSSRAEEKIKGRRGRRCLCAEVEEEMGEAVGEWGALGRVDEEEMEGGRSARGLEGE